MRQRPFVARVRSLIDTDPPDDALGRIARVDALLRAGSRSLKTSCSTHVATLSQALKEA